MHNDIGFKELSAMPHPAARGGEGAPLQHSRPGWRHEVLVGYRGKGGGQREEVRDGAQEGDVAVHHHQRVELSQLPRAQLHPVERVPAAGVGGGGRVARMVSSVGRVNTVEVHIRRVGTFHRKAFPTRG